MILPNVQKYEFLENNNDNYRALRIAVVKGNVLFCPKLGGIYTWWQPKASPNDGTGGWSKLKHIDMPNKVSLWDKKSSDMENHITDIVEGHLDCYLVPMKDVSYSCYETDGVNFNIYVKHDGIFYSTNVVDKKDTLTVVSISKDYCGTLYSLEDNSVVYENKVPIQTTLDSWMTVDPDEGWDWNQVDNLIYPDNTPTTPRTPACRKNLMDSFDNEVHNIDKTMELLEDSDELDEPDIELTSGSDEDELEDDIELTSGSDDDLDLEDDIELSDDVELECDSEKESEYSPSEVSSEQSDYTVTTVDDNHEQDYYDDSYDELRQDLDGTWYTRRQFYDFYGSDAAWDNQDPHVFQNMRFDENEGLWYTKEQFYQYYGTDVIWMKMHPKKQLMRQTICNIYKDAQHLPEQLQHSFIHRFLGTY